MTSDDHTTHLRLHLHGLISCTRADLIQVKRHVLFDNFGNSRGTQRWLSSLCLGGSVLINSVGDKPCQQDEKQVSPFGNSLIRSADWLCLGHRRALWKAVIHDFLIAHRRIDFHLDPLRIVPFLEIETPRLIWPLWPENRCAAAFSPRVRSLSLFSARSRIRASTFIHI